MLDLDKKVKPRKLTRAEIAARVHVGIDMFDAQISDPDVLAAFQELQEGRKSNDERTRHMAELKHDLLFGYGGPFNPTRLVYTASASYPNDTLSYSAMEKCNRDMQNTYPEDAYQEMKDAGIIENFYMEVCTNCDDHDNCHTRPWRI
jgi:hypothetical protein